MQLWQSSKNPATRQQPAAHYLFELQAESTGLGYRGMQSTITHTNSPSHSPALTNHWLAMLEANLTPVLANLTPVLG